MATELELLCGAEDTKITHMYVEYRRMEDQWSNKILKRLPAIFAQAVAKELFAASNLTSRLWQITQVSTENRRLHAIPEVFEDLYQSCLNAISRTSWEGPLLTNSLNMEIQLRRPLQKYFSIIPVERRRKNQELVGRAPQRCSSRDKPA